MSHEGAKSAKMTRKWPTYFHRLAQIQYTDPGFVLICVNL